MKAFLLLLLLFISFSLEKEYFSGRKIASSAKQVNCSTLLRLMMQEMELNELDRLIARGELDIDTLASNIDQRLLAQLQFRYQKTKVLERLPSNLSAEVSDMPLEHASGDFWNVVELEDGRVAFFVGDGAGHGTAPAISSIRLHQFMDNEHGFARIIGKKESSDAQNLMKYIDARTQFLEPHQMALSTVVVDAESGVMDFAKAGTPDIFVKKANGAVEQLSNHGGFVGEQQLISYSSFNGGNLRYQLQEGDSVIVFTDGLSDANQVISGNNSHNGLLDQLKGIIEYSEASLTDIRQNLLSRIKSKDDDITLMLFRWK